MRQLYEARKYTACGQNAEFRKGGSYFIRVEGCLRFGEVDGYVQQELSHRRYLLRLPDWRLGLGDVCNKQGRGVHDREDLQ